MKTVAHIGPLGKRYLDPQTVRALSEIVPGAMQDDAFECDLPENDPRHAAIVASLGRMGFSPAPRWAADYDLGRQRLYPYVIIRHYDPEDIEGASYLVISPRTMFRETISPASAGMLHVRACDIPPGEEIGYVGNRYAVTDRIRNVLQDAAMRNVVLHETKVHGREGTGFRGDIWELTSDLVLPWLSPPSELLTDRGKPSPADGFGSCFLHEGWFTPPELHYREKAIAEVEPFDLALTWETFEGPPYHPFGARHLVVSHRLYDLLLQRDVPVDWIPVRVGPDPEGEDDAKQPRGTIVPVSQLLAPPPVPPTRDHGVKAIAHIGPIAEYLIDPQMLEELGEIYPEGVQSDTFECELRDDDPRHAAIIDCLEQWGFEPEPCWEVNDDLGEMSLFPYIIQRYYQGDDFRQAPYLQPRPTVSFGDKPSPPGILHLHARSIPPGEEIGLMGGHFVISDRVKGLLEAEATDLRGIVTLPTRTHGREGSNLEGGYWELTSVTVLPPVSPVCQLVDEYGEAVAAGSEGCYLYEGRYQPPELHYRAVDLQDLEPFGLGLTHEHFGPPGLERPRLIASQRFYQFCVEHSLKMDWVPVRVDAA